MHRLPPALLLALAVSLTGCGFTETATTTAAVAESKKQELEQGRQTQERIVQGIATAGRQNEKRLRSAEER